MKLPEEIIKALEEARELITYIGDEPNKKANRLFWDISKLLEKYERADGENIHPTPITPFD